MPIAYFEQWQNEFEDHDIIAVPVDEIASADSIDLAEVSSTLTTFIAEVFAHDPGRVLRSGRMLSADDAVELIATLKAASP